jgi:hypothetical protein
MKIAFVDIDGTILNYPSGLNKPTEKCLEAFRKFRDQGNQLIIATSRSKLPAGLTKEMFDGFVFSNGQYIEYHNEILLNNCFTIEQILFQKEIYEKYNAGMLYSGVIGQWINPFREDLAIDHMVHFGLDISKVNEIFLPFDINQIQCTATTAVFDDVENMWLAKAELPEDWIVHAYDEESIRMDVHLPGVTKGSSCVFLTEHSGLKREDSYAFGDGMNDIEMLDLVGYGIAMGNATEEVKRCADFVTSSVDEDGLAKAFVELFNL